MPDKNSGKVRHGLLLLHGRAPARVNASARVLGQKVRLGAIDHPQSPAAKAILINFIRQTSETVKFG
jgi:hypothetical protein